MVIKHPWDEIEETLNKSTPQTTFYNILQIHFVLYLDLFMYIEQI